MSAHPNQSKTPWDQLTQKQQQKALVQTAQHLSSRKNFKLSPTVKYNYDCSGYIFAILHYLSFDFSSFQKAYQSSGNGVRQIHTFMQRHGRIIAKHKIKKILPGDILFFSNTHDRNRDKQWNDSFTHIGIVIETTKLGGATYLNHRSQSKIFSDHINLKYPNQHKLQNGQIANSYLRRKSKQTTSLQNLSAHLLDSIGRF